MKNVYKNIAILLIFINYSCVEEIDLVTETDFESLLVIEATITNEQKQHKILLSKTFKFEENGPIPESSANVMVIGDGLAQNFQELEPGVYISLNDFAAQSNVDYHLEITTSDGNEYRSTIKQLTQPTQVDSLYVERGFNEDNDDGVSVFIDAFDPSGESKFYRFEYEETYKVIAPLYSPMELIPNNVPFPILEGSDEIFDIDDINVILELLVVLQFREEQEQICYNTVKSNQIIIASTNELQEDKLDHFKLRFLKRDNYIISHRYSFLVKQFIQSREAYTYYKALRDFSSNMSLFSETQTGFLEGNVFSVSNRQEKVIGFFDVSSVAKQRAYFNYSDVFPGEQLPSYYISCDSVFKPALIKEDFRHNIIGSPLLDALNFGMIHFETDPDEPPFPFNPFSYSPYSLVVDVCGDCTILGANVVPDFWVD